MDTPYNKNHRGTFNEGLNAPTDFHEITNEDRQRAADRLKQLIDDTHERLYPVSEIERLED